MERLVRYIEMSAKNKKGRRSSQKYLAHLSALSPELQRVVTKDDVKRVIIEFENGTQNVFELDRTPEREEFDDIVKDI